MHTIKIDLSNNLKQIKIHTFADWHIGDVHCDMRLIRERIKEVADDERSYCILNGDIMNNATKTSVSDSYAEVIPPMEQIKMCVDLLEPIKDKILAIAPGNHENRTYIKEGIDLTQIVAMQLGLGDRYTKTGSLIFVRFGHNCKQRKMCYTIYTIHGSGGGRKEGAKAIRLADMASIIDADVYIHSHTHLPMIMKQSFYRVDCPNSAVSQVDKLFINTGATLNYGGYGQAFEFKPSSKDSPIIYLDGTKKIMEAKL